MSLGKSRTIGLWIIASVLMLDGVIDNHDDSRHLAILVALMAVASSVSYGMRSSTVMLAHLLALFREDVPCDSKSGREAVRLMHPPAADD